MSRWSKFSTPSEVSNDNNDDNDTGFDFADDATQEYEQLIAAQASAGASNMVVMDNGDDIDVDDI